ncbi:C2 family cysteine protease [Aureispira anguillae]|nr:C2 family cysteine protease [Aureispira anguillae]
MAFLKKITELKEQIKYFEELTANLEHSSNHKQFAIQLSALKKLLDQHLMSNKWQVKWWTNTPIEVEKDQIKVRVQVGGFKFTEADKTTPITVLIRVSFDSTEVSTTLNQPTKSNDGWHAFRGEVQIPIDFLSGSFTINVTTTVGGKTHSLSDQRSLPEIDPEGQEVLAYLNGLNLEKDSLTIYAKLKTETVEGKSLRELDAFKAEIEAAIADIQNNMLSPAQNMSGAGKALFEKLLKEQPINCKSYFHRHYESEWKDGTTAYYNIMHFVVNLHTHKISDFTTEYIQPLQTKLAEVVQEMDQIKTANAKIEAAYHNNLIEIAEKTAIGGIIVRKIKEICGLIADYEALKEDHAFLNEPEGTDAFKLVVKDRDTVIQPIFQTLEGLKAKHVALGKTIVENYDLLYRPNGSLRGGKETKALRKELKKEENEATFSLSIFTTEEEVLILHEHIFGKIKLFATRATDFYKDYHRIWLDFSRIDQSTPEMSIKAYDPILDKEFKEKFEKSIETFDDGEKARSGLSLGEVNNTLTDEQGINPEDVQQGSIGDCYFLSGVEALARFDANQIYGGPDSIISEPDSDGNYTVQLYIPDPLPTDAKHLRRVRIKVKPTFVEAKIVLKNTKQVKTSTDPEYLKPEKTPFFAKSGKEEKKGEKGEMWVQLLEKAIAELEGSYGEITGDKNEIPLSGLEMLTGQRSTNYSLPVDLDTAINALITAQTTNQQTPMAKFATKSILPAMGSSAIGSGEKHTLYRPNTRLYAKHAYSLVRIINTTVNNEVFQLQNPHNHDIVEEGQAIDGGRLIEVTRAELSTYFSSIEIN